MTDTKKYNFTDHLGMPLNSVRRRAINEFNKMVYFGELKLEPVTNCFCNSSNFEVLSRYDRYGLPFGTQICRDCGLISQTINIAEASMEKFYDKIYWLLMYGTEDDIEYSTQLAGMDKFIPFICDDMNFNKRKLKFLKLELVKVIALGHWPIIFRTGTILNCMATIILRMP